MREPAAFDHSDRCDATEESPLPPLVLARLAALASTRAYLGFIPTQSRVPA